MTTMRFSEIRQLLIEEHRHIRSLAAAVSDAAHHVLAGDPAADATMREGLDRLERALGAHNVHEDTLLRDIVPTIDAWGKLRESLLTESHAHEHAALTASIGECRRSSDPHVTAAQVTALVTRMLGHMDAEEREILHPDILRDDVIAISGVSG